MKTYYNYQYPHSHLVCHAEYNAFINRGDKSIKGSTLYIGLFPCKDCAKLITQAGVNKVIFKEDRNKKTYKIAKKIFGKTKVEYRYYDFSIFCINHVFFVVNTLIRREDDSKFLMNLCSVLSSNIL